MSRTLLSWNIRGYKSAAACVAFSWLAAAAACGQKPGDVYPALRTGTLTVWESGRPTFLEWDRIRAALAEDFPGLQVKFQLQPADAFLPALHAAEAQGALPDVVFIDNWGQGGPFLTQFRAVQMLGHIRFALSRGWWFHMKDGGNQPAAESFLRWLEESPQPTEPRFPLVGMSPADREQSTAAGAQAIAALADGSDNSATMDADAARFSTSEWGVSCGPIAEIEKPNLRFISGNGRFAVAGFSSHASTREGSVECAGVLQSFVVLRKREDGWKVLLLMPISSEQRALSMGDNFARLNLLPSAIAAPAVPFLLAPADWEKQTRFPKQQISWQQSGANRAEYPAAYIVESRAGVYHGDRIKYGPGAITFVDPGNYGPIVRMQEPFGVGMQPHMWRVWAVGRDGQIALSEWRTVDFTN